MSITIFNFDFKYFVDIKKYLFYYKLLNLYCAMVERVDFRV